MEKWDPNVIFIDKIKSMWLKADVLDKPYALSQEGRTVGDMIKTIKNDTSEIIPTVVAYIEKNFSLEQKLCDHHLTGQEALDAMRQGTPYGILLYYALYIHEDCCLNDKIDVPTY